MPNFRESKVAAAQAALKEASDEEDNRQIKVGEVKALYDDTKAALAEFENRLAHCSSELSEIKRQKAVLAKKLSVAISRSEGKTHRRKGGPQILVR